MKNTEINIRDPFVLAENGTYYMYGTRAATCWMAATGFDCYVSEDMENWDGPYEVFRKPEDFWADMNCWAPEVHKYQGAYYMFATFKDSSVHGGTAILKSESPLGPFVMHSDRQITPKDWECIDGTFYVSPDGKPYMVFVHEWVQISDGSICAVELNLDFEGIKKEAGVHYIQFIRELSVSCRKEGIVLSVDNYVPYAGNEFYNRKEQGIVADYVIVMGYDEHYAGGEPGSVASIGYVNDGISNTLKQVPKEKLINAIPLYTRVWTEEADGKTSSVALGIARAKEWAVENNVELFWQEELGQYYGELKTEEGTKKVWMEEERSIGLKMDLIRKYDLAGVACWKLGFEPAELWDEIRMDQE